MLQRKGMPARDITKDAETGSCRLTVDLSWGTQVIELIISFPVTYPDTPFEVLAPGLDLPHHQNPLGKNLCTLQRPFTNWNRDTSVADFLLEQLPKVLEAGTTQDPERASGIEAHQAEPNTSFLEYERGSVILVDGGAVIDSATKSGKLEFELACANMLIKATLVKATSGDKQWKQEIQKQPWKPSIAAHGVWVRTSKTPHNRSAEQYLHDQTQEHRKLKEPIWNRVGNTALALYGFLIPEEDKWRHEGESWIFILQRKNKAIARSPTSTQYIRTLRADWSTMKERLPDLGGLQNHRLALFGVGCVGAPLVLELSKLGFGRLHLVDHDVVEPGPTVRWPLGAFAVGNLKVLALRDFIRLNFPQSEVEVSSLRFGNGLDAVGLQDYNDILAEATVIVDATAEDNITWALARIARKRGLPFVSLATSLGGFGGHIIALSPLDSACAECVVYHQADGAVSRPPYSTAGEIQPAGCADPTFIATSYDTSEISLSAVRSIVSLISTQKPELKLQGNYFVLSLRDEEGQVILPRWETFSLERHPLCPNHLDLPAGSTKIM